MGDAGGHAGGQVPDGVAGDTELPPPLENVDGAPTEIHSSAAFEAVLRADRTGRGADRFGPEPGSGVSSVPAAVVSPTEPPEHTHVAAPPDVAIMAARVAPPPPRAPKSVPTLPKAAPPPMRPRVATIVHAGAPPQLGSGSPVGAFPGTLVGAPVGSSKASSADLTAAAAAALGVPLSRHCTTCDARYPADFLVCPRDATPLVEETEGVPADPLVGMLVGDTYQLIRLVGEGGMGRVYEARHLRLKERRFAIKTLHTDLARNPEIVARFMREAESASSLAHENVIDVFDVHHLPDGTPYLVGEFLEGEELAVHVSRYGPLSAQKAAIVARQVCSALAAAHARGIIHRDMKPENIFVLQSSIDAVTAGEASSLTVKVLDFGISKATGADRTDLTRTGVIMGTPSYMSPEQASGKEVDLRADIYSLGAVLYFSLTGKRPFDAPDPTSTLSMVLTQVPPRLRSVDAQIPETLELIVQRAMAKDPRDRFQTMMEFEKALAALDPGIREFRAPVPVEMQPLDANASGPTRALDIAKNLFAGTATPSPGEMTALAKLARPTLVVASTVVGLWFLGSIIAALAGLVRVLHDGEITLTECVLLVVGCMFAALTPGVLYVLHVRKVIWPNSVWSMQLAADLRRTATAALVAYGALSMSARIVHTVLWRNSSALTSGGWDISLLLFSLVAAITIGGMAPLLRNLRRRKRRA